MICELIFICTMHYYSDYFTNFNFKQFIERYQTINGTAANTRKQQFKVTQHIKHVLQS